MGDFGQTSWHDDTLYGVTLDAAEATWRCNLVLDIDHIVEWVRTGDQRPRFRVAPATLVFTHVTDLDVQVRWGATEYRGSQSALASILDVTREPVAEQKVCLDRPYYAWTIELASDAGHIRFGADAFQQTLRVEPMLCDEQQLPAAVRDAVRDSAAGPADGSS